MYSNQIILLSTLHSKNGNCNPEELYKILCIIEPDVIFLEAVSESYTHYDQFLFSQFGVFSKRLEIEAIQRFRLEKEFEYVPVLDFGLSNDFMLKVSILANNSNYKILLDNYISLESEHGFEFLNSNRSVELQDKMKNLEEKILGNNKLNQRANVSIDSYENNMLQNIYSYCRNKSFNKAIFMCGAAHRKSLAEKIKHNEKQSNDRFDWTLYNEAL